MNHEATIQRIAIDRVRPYAGQPRTEFAADRIDELAESLRAYGQQSPVIVRRHVGGTDADSYFELVDGERRWRALRLLGAATIEAVVRHIGAGDEQFLTAVIANAAREDLSPIEAARAVARVWEMPQFASVETRMERLRRVAAAFGRSTTWVAQQLDLLSLPAEVQTLVETDKLGQTAALELKRIPSTERQAEIGKRIARSGLRHSEAGKLVRQAVSVEAAREGRGRVPSEDAKVLLDLVTRVRESSELILDLPQRSIAAAYLGKPDACDRAVEALDTAIAVLTQVRQALDRMGSQTRPAAMR